MKTTLLRFMLVFALLTTGALSVHGLVPNDADGDGVPDDVDQCPAENSAGFDRNGDGCIDDFIGARHIEYWGVADANVTYFINATAAPNINDGSDITAVRNAVEAWPSISNTHLNVVYGGTLAQETANALDHINLVTFLDQSFVFSNLVLAVGLSTSFEADTTIGSRVYRKGEIFDADMLFNPSKTFKTGGAGPGTDIRGVATHEAGHMFGLSHSSVKSSTMFYALPGGTAARSLESDDRLVYFKAYGDSLTLANSQRIQGTVTNGTSGDPVPGAIVFIINSTTGDTTACDYTLPDGTFTFPGLTNGSYYVSIHPLDGTSPIGFIEPGNINSLVAATAETNFGPESYDAAESNTDNPAARTAVTVSNGSPVATANIVTNIDASAPEVLSASPGDGASGVAVDGAYIIHFSEPIKVGSIRDGFSFRDINTGLAKGGNIGIIHDDSVIVFTPSPPLAFATDYRLRLDTDLQDKAGNHLAADFTLVITTESEPALAISSLAPNKGITGNTVVINGQGFDSGPPTVTFNGVPAGVSSATVGRLVVTVPEAATTGPVVVTNADMTVSNSLTFSVLSRAEVARGYESGQAVLSDTPNAITVTPSGDYAYIAATGGAHAVVINAALGAYLSQTPIPYPTELVDIAATPQGTRVYAVSFASGEMVEINSDPTTGLLFNSILASRALGAGPKGICVSPTGQRAFIPTDAADIQVWDIELGSIHYQQQVGSMAAPVGSTFMGAAAVTPAGDRLLALTDAGSVAFYDLSAETLLVDLSVGPDLRGLIIDGAGQRAYVTHGNGDVSVVNVAGNPFKVQDIATGGSLRNLVLTPAATFIYAADRELDEIKIIDLDEGSSTFRSVIENIGTPNNPVDIALSPGGEYAFSVLQGGGLAPGGGIAQPRMVVTTIGIGPTLQAVYPLSARVGAMVVLTGSDFGDPADFEIATVDFNGVTASAVQQSSNRVVTIVPGGATSGPVRIHTTISGGQESNAVFFNVFSPGSSPYVMRQSITIPGNHQEDYSAALAMRPQGDVVFVGTAAGRILAYDTRPGSPTFHQEIGHFLALSSSVKDLAVTADGKALFAVASGSTDMAIKALNADPNQGLFGEELAAFTAGGSLGDGLSHVETSPDNRQVVVFDSANETGNMFDATNVAQGIEPVYQWSYGGPPFSNDLDLEFNPSGLALYSASALGTDYVRVVNTNPSSPSYGLVTENIPIPGTPPVESPVALAVSPQGTMLYVVTMQLSGPITRSLYQWPVDPLTGMTTGSPTRDGLTGAGGPLYLDRIQMAPRGDKMIRGARGGLFYMDLLVPPVTNVSVLGVQETLVDNDFEFSPDGNRLYFASTFFDSLRVYEFNAAFFLNYLSGNSQNGVVGTNLTAPLRVGVRDFEPGNSIPGASVTFRVTSGGGGFVVGQDVLPEVTIATDAIGVAQITWQLGPQVGTQTAECSSYGLVNSPLVFSAGAAPDPESLPLTMAELIPVNGSINVSATTAVLATFNRAVDPATINSATLFITVQADATLVPVTYGFTDNNRKVSMTPSHPLAYSTAFRVNSTGGVHTPTGDALTNPAASTMMTGAAPPLLLRSISPPAGLVGSTVTLSGTGFNANPAANVVSFHGTTATPVSGDASQLRVIVPATATTGPVTVTANAITSNALTFTVLVPTTSPIDEVIATIGTGAGAKSCTVTPDGALCYTVSPDGDVVIPVDIDGATTYPAITVGDQPVAIVMHPSGRFAYVANFNSGTVSVIDVDQASATFNTVVSTITVGSNPTDLAALPDGDRVLVVNGGSGDVGVIDSDGSSATYNSVIATIGQGTGAKSCTVSPDGTRLYVGTNTGFVVIQAGSYDVIATIGTGAGAKSCTVSPDGTLLFILTTSGTILIVDVSPGSASENEVIATIGAGSGAKSCTVSPDGTLLYVLQEDSDTVLVIAINVIPGVSATDPNAGAPSFTVETSVIDEVPVGAEPSFVAVDPSGTGKVFVTNAGDKSLTVINGSDHPFHLIQARLKIIPPLLILKANFPYMLGWVQLPSGHSVHDIDVNTVKVFGSVPAVVGHEIYGDFNFDGIGDVTYEFVRDDFVAAMPQGEKVPVPITGKVLDQSFAGIDTLHVLRPTVTYPKGGEMLAGDKLIEITWTSPHGFFFNEVDIHWSGDNGQTWNPIALHVPNNGHRSWRTPQGNYPQARVRVTLYLFDKPIGDGMSAAPFQIMMPVAVSMKNIGLKMEEGTAILQWMTEYETDTDGFQVVRAEATDGDYRAVTTDMIQAHGPGEDYEYRDESIRPNRTYYYKLQEIVDGNAEHEFGPFEARFALKSSLEQNAPNPFNPTTTIRYAIAEDAEVRLLVYDVAGRRVRTLVNQRQRADYYRIAWDGVNDQGERVASGVYFYKLVAGKFSQTRKMVLLK